MSPFAPRMWLGPVLLLAAAWPASGQDLPPAPIPVVLQPSSSSPPTSPKTSAASTKEQPASAQQPALLPAPTPAGPLPPGPLPPAPAPAVVFDGPADPAWRCNVIVEHPSLPPCGWFAEAGVSIVGPHVKNRLSAQVTVPFDPIINPHIMSPIAPGDTRPQRFSITDTVHLPGAPLEWAGAPEFGIGYRMPDGWGEFVASYRLLNTDGAAVLPGFDLDGSPGWLHSRLSVNVFDLDYASTELAPAPFWDMRWRVGVRVGGVFFDSQAAAWFIEEKVSNNFWGAGPHVGLELARAFPSAPELALYAGVDGSALLGEIRQSFSEAFFLDDGTAVGGATTRRQTQAVPTVRLQAGLRWTPAPAHGMRVFAGYELESWWYLGTIDNSRAELVTQGLFLRAEWPF